MQSLKPLSIPLVGKNLIQASAGTGKTWTISLLYVRLIVEQLLTVEQILVVTYTRAATEELRSRIRARLKETLAVYQAPDSAHHEYRELLALYPTDAQRVQYLKRALLSFDEAAVFTIHGFCQRVLQRHAFEVGLPFESELVDSEASLQLQLTDQFWQQRMVRPSALDALVLSQAKSPTPDDLLDTVARFVDKPYLTPIRPKTVTDADYRAARAVYDTHWQQLTQSWPSAKSSVQAALLTGALNKNTYSANKVKTLLALVEHFLAGHAVEDAASVLEALTPNHLKVKTNKNKQTPDHPFFHAVAAFLPHYTTLQLMQETALDQVRYDLLIWLREQLPERKRQAGILAFDDLLIKVQQALLLRPKLAGQLSEQYRVALIDEFQDTDPVQYQVFEQIYRDGDGQVYYVGDPKQAIYSFRGADIYTYLQAAHGVPATQHYTLDRNFRSQPRLLAAFNCLYAPALDPFRNQQRIGYESVSAGGTVEDSLNCQPAIAPLRLWDWDGSACAGSVNASTVLQRIAQAVANDIAQLLQQAQQGKACIGQRPLSSGDFAVLVRNHKHGRIIRDALQACGITSVQKSPLSIFQTQEAQELRLILAAIAEPNHIAHLRRALVTELMGGNAQTLLELDQDPLRFDRELEDFFNWHQLWQTQGFMRMLHAWMERRAVRSRLLSYVDGERRLTNVLHLGELIHAETRRDWRGMQATLRWLQRNSRETKGEEHQLRLESDENLVQIVTVHKSKGLQYPIVYCPFLWYDPKKTNHPDWFAWHDTQSNRSCLQASKYQLEQAKNRLKAEQDSEDLRLLYVALTRAQYQCTLVLATGALTKSMNDSALNWLLFGHLPDSDALLGDRKAMAPEQRQQRMQAVLMERVEQSAGAIHYQALPTQDTWVPYQAPPTQTELKWREFQHVIPSPARIGSFSGLTAGQHDEGRDYDQSPSLELYRAPAEQPLDTSQFPTGRRAGVCLHHIFEQLDFQQPLQPQRDRVIYPALEQAGFASIWRPAAEQLIQQALHAPLMAGQTWSLAHISRSERLDELEFYFPVNQLKVSALKKLLNAELPTEWSLIRAAAARLSFADLNGFMKGYIDLVFRHAGRYYLVDYKSNRLGASAADYAPTALLASMAEAHYYLQYLIYCVALHRYLQQRLTGYAWDTHVGGVFYLYLRGMGLGTAQNGVFFHQPPFKLIHALDQLLAN